MNQGKQTFIELLAGIGISGAVASLGAIVWSGPKTEYLFGLAAGVLLALFLTWDMYTSIDRALDMDQKPAGAYTKKKAMLRLVVMIAVLAAAVFIQQISVAGVIIGGLTLKFSAYLQPLTHKFIEKFNKRKVRE